MSSRWTRQRFSVKADSTILQPGEGSTSESDSDPDEAKSPPGNRRKLESNILLSTDVFFFGLVIRLYHCFRMCFQTVHPMVKERKLSETG